MTPTLLIADDEPLLARVLESELAALWPEARIVGVVHDGVAALEAARQHEPTVVFLDIRMPGMSGMDVARELVEFDAPPLVVFVTAYDQFALEAFERAAVDYVLKPVQHERLEATVARLKRVWQRHRPMRGEPCPGRQRQAGPTAQSPGSAGEPGSGTRRTGAARRVPALHQGAGRPGGAHHPGR